MTKLPSPSLHIDEQLADAALGTLVPAEQAAVTAHLDQCARCRKRLQATRETLAAVSLTVPATRPPRSLRDNLLGSIDPQRAAVPYAGFATRLRRMFQLDEQQTLDVLRKSADPAAWEEQGPIALLHFSAGASLPNTHAGFMRCTAGLRFPHHLHVGHEHMLMLAGTLQVEDTGKIYYPGDALLMGPGSEHAFSFLPPHDCVFAVLLEESWPLFTGK